MKRRHASSIVLEALHLGLEVNLAGLDVMFDEEYNLTIAAYNGEGDKLPDVRLRIDYGDIGCFIRGCEMIPDDELILIAADITMNKIGRKR